MYALRGMAREWLVTWLVGFALLTGCAGTSGQVKDEEASEELEEAKERIEDLEEELEETKAELEKEKAAKADAEAQAATAQRKNDKLEKQMETQQPGMGMPGQPGMGMMPPMPPPPPPVRARIIEMVKSGSDLLITINAGSNRNVDKKWSGQILRGDRGEEIVATFQVTKVDEEELTGRVRNYTVAELGSSRRVVLRAPVPEGQAAPAAGMPPR